MKFSIRVVLATAFLAAGCAAPAKVDKPREQMTQRERDSTIAESGLVGAGVVGRALSVSDAEAQRTAQLDSASQ
jgi:hypothetical protein